jgi:hypothetical protein
LIIFLTSTDEHQRKLWFDMCGARLDDCGIEYDANNRPSLAGSEC